jgi:hypothetical protein
VDSLPQPVMILPNLHHRNMLKVKKRQALSLVWIWLVMRLHTTTGQQNMSDSFQSHIYTHTTHHELQLPVNISVACGMQKFLG